MIENSKMPTHVGIIMDGNGRFAKERNLPRSLGHQEGAKNLKELLYHIYDMNLKYVSLFAFPQKILKEKKKKFDF